MTFYCGGCGSVFEEPAQAESYADEVNEDGFHDEEREDACPDCGAIDIADLSSL